MSIASIVWIVLMLLFIVIEAATPQLVTIWFALGSLGGLIAELCHAQIWLQIIIFVIITVICLILTRPLAKKLRNTEIQPTNADRYLGEKGIVTEDIDNILGKGAVKVKGTEWTARSFDDNNIAAGTSVIVKEIQGVKLMVLPVNS